MMLSRKSYIVLFLAVISLISNNCLAEKIPDKFMGNWSITLVPQSGFPWWREVKYPVKLILTPDGGNMVDQYGFKCSLSKIFYDNELDIIIFKHCGMGEKSDLAFQVLQLAHIDDKGQLHGEVKTYKKLFGWIGVKDDSLRN